MPSGTLSLPKVSLERAQWIRLVVVGFFVVFAAARVAPDLFARSFRLAISIT